MTALELTDEQWAAQESIHEMESLSPTDRLRVQLLSGAAIREIPPPSRLVDGLLDLDTTAVLYGRSGVGKSFVALDLALTVARGALWFGRHVERVPVLYVVAEGAAGVGERVDAWLSRRGLDEIENIYWLPVAVNITEIGWLEALEVVALETGARLIVLDTLARCMVGSDENSARDMGIVVNSMDRLRRTTGGCVLAVHHTGKSAEAGMRGSSALEASLDTAIECQGDERHIVLTARKQKYRAGGHVERLKLTEYGASCVLDRAIGGADEDVSESALLLLRALAESDDGNGMGRTAWQRITATEMPERTFYRRTKELIENGFTANVGSDKRPRYVVTAEGREAIHCQSATSLPTTAMAAGQNTAATATPLWGGGVAVNPDSKSRQHARDRAADALDE